MAEAARRTAQRLLLALLAAGLFGHGWAKAEQPLADAAALLNAQQAKLQGVPGVLVLDRPARLHGDLTLGKGQSLHIDAPLVVGHATIHLLGGNEIRCAAPVQVDDATDLFVAEGADDLSVRGCDVEVTGHEGGVLLTATRAHRVTAEDNHLVNMALFNTHNQGGPASETTDVSLVGNSSVFTRGIGPIGIYLLYVLRATVSNNRFAGTGHGVEWWGGDGNLGWHGAAAVTGAGDLSITGNQCYSAGGACVWGSMGFNVTVSGNSADVCSDVCFDTEGGVRNLFTGNVAQHCGNGCFSAQMESVDAVFSGNFAYADAQGPALALFLIKHRNGNPAPHQNLTVTGNTLSCATLCTAFYTEGEDGLEVARNTVTNGRFVFANYTNSVRVLGNSLRFTLPLGPHAAIEGPSVAWGHRSLLQGNVLTVETVEPDPGSTCIAQSWSDDNNTDEMRIAGNTCLGFATGIVTLTAGHNAGAPKAVWTISGNTVEDTTPGRELVHSRQSGNEQIRMQP